MRLSYFLALLSAKIITTLFVPAVLADNLPDLGEASQAVFSPQQERRIGEEIMQEIRASRSNLDDAELTEYINNLGYRLVASSPDNRRSIEFFLVQDDTLNAFALPGGYIGVHTGLILATQNESELASVMAHEIAHIEQKHLSRMIASTQQNSLSTLAAVAVAILAARSNPQVANAALVSAQAASIQTQLNFTRDHEREADRIGLQILEHADFDTHAMPAFFERLQKYGRVYDNNAPAYLRTHPLTTERIADVENRVASLPYKQVKSSLEFQLLRAKLRAMQGDAELTVADFSESLKDKKYESEPAARYGYTYALIRTRQYGRAEQEITKLRGLVKSSAIVETLAAEIKVASGQFSAALDIYHTALKRFPQHRALIYGYAEMLLENKQAKTAEKFLANQIETAPNDFRLYGLLARSHAAQGRVFLQHQAQAEAYARSGNVPAAIEQLQIAIKSGDSNFYLLSSAESRLKELHAIVAENQKKP
jgi:predicted Zn-dependent protease